MVAMPELRLHCIIKSLNSFENLFITTVLMWQNEQLNIEKIIRTEKAKVVQIFITVSIDHKNQIDKLNEITNECVDTQTPYNSERLDTVAISQSIYSRELHSVFDYYNMYYLFIKFSFNLFSFVHLPIFQCIRVCALAKHRI